MTEKEFYKKWIDFALTLTIAGVEIKCNQQAGIFDNVIYKISVPEKHELIDDYTSEEMMKEVKEEICDLMYELCESETDEEKEIVRRAFKVLGKVRSETWTQEKYDEKKSQIDKELELLKSLGDYKEI